MDECKVNKFCHTDKLTLNCVTVQFYKITHNIYEAVTVYENKSYYGSL
jgi:hypothetical protein